MTFTIKNGVLTVGAKRIILAHVIAYDATQSTLIIYFSNHRESLNMGVEAVKCAAALDVHFEHPAVWVGPEPLTEEAIRLIIRNEMFER